MSALENAFRNAVANAHDQRGKPAILGKSDGTLYWVDPSGMTHRTRVWARIGEQASNQEVVVDCLRASPQIDMPVRVDYMNGRMTVVDVDSQRAVEFSGGRPPGAGAHAWTHNRLGPDPVFIEGLQFLPLLVTPTSPPDLTVTVQSGAYTDDAGDLAIHDTAASGSLSAFVPGTGHHFVIVCLDRTDGSIALVDGSDVTVEDALFGDAVVTAADIEAITISDDYKPLGVVLLYASQTQIKARDIIKDLRNDGGAGGGGTPGGSDTQIQFNDGGVFGGADVFWDGANNRLGVGAATPAAKLHINETEAATTLDIRYSSQVDTLGSTISRQAYYAFNDAAEEIEYVRIQTTIADATDGSEDGSYEIYRMTGGVSAAVFSMGSTSSEIANTDIILNGTDIQIGSLGWYADFTASGVVFNEGGQDRDFRIEGDTATNLFVADAGLDTVRIGTTVAGDIAQFGPLGLVLNTGQANIDFRLAGDGVANGIYYDASENRTGFNTNSPNTTVDINGSASFRVNGIALSNGGNHNVSIGDYTWVRATGPTAAFTVTGFTGGADGRILIFAGAVAQAMTVANNSASSTAGNRIFTTTGADVVLGTVGKAIFIYDGTSSAWRMFMGNGSNGAQ